MIRKRGDERKSEYHENNFVNGEKIQSSKKRKKNSTLTYKLVPKTLATNRKNVVKTYCTNRG